MESSELIEKKELKQPSSYISYQNYEGSSRIRLTEYKSTAIEEEESLVPASELNNIKDKGVSEFMEKENLED